MNNLLTNNEKNEESLLEKLVHVHGYDETLKILAKAAGYKEIPPSVDTLIDDGQYLKNILTDEKGVNTFFPVWRSALKEIYPNPFYSPYTTVVFTGCLTGDVGIKVSGHKEIKIKDLYEHYKSKNLYNKIKIISINNETGKIEYKEVTDCQLTIKNAPVYNMKLANGDNFRATESHKFLVKGRDDWIELKDIEPGDILYMIKDSSLKNSADGVFDKIEELKLKENNSKKFSVRDWLNSQKVGKPLISDNGRLLNNTIYLGELSYISKDGNNCYNIYRYNYSLNDVEKVSEIFEEYLIKLMEINKNK